MKTTNNLNNKQFKNQFNLLKQIVMKKQILLLIVAFFAVTTAFGQALPGSAPRGYSCIDDFLHPIAGKEYTYPATTDPTGGNYLFWATKDPNFITTTSGTTSMNDGTKLITATGDLIATSTNYGTAGTTPDVKITWSDKILSGTSYQGASAPKTPTFVAVYYNGSTACADNLKVYELDPITAFTVDVRNIEDGAKTPMGYDILDDQCIDQVRGAKYVSGAMQYDYGQNVFYFEVIAANFTDYFIPTLTVGALGATQTATIDWTYDKPATWSATTVWTPYAANTHVTTTETNTNAGVSIYVRVTVANNQFENNATAHAAGIPVTLTVDAQNSVNIWDIDNGSGAASGTLCNTTTAADNADVATQTLLPRPAITGGTSAIAPNTTIITGNEQN